MPDTLPTDVRYALRGLRSAPGFTMVGVVSLALGIGASAAVFGLFDAVVLNPLPAVRAADRVVEVADQAVSYPAFLDFRDRAGGFDGVVAYGFRTLNLRRESGSELIEAGVVSGGFFGVVGVEAVVGRMPAPADDEPGAPLVAVLDHGAWRDWFGGDPGVVGRSMTMNGRDFTIVGVAPPGFRGLKLGVAPTVWVPIQAWAAVKTGPYARLDVRNRGWSWLLLAGRLAPGTSIAAAEAELAAVRRWQRETFPRLTPDRSTLELVPVAAAAAGFGDADDVHRFVVLLMGAVGLALAIACANLANLLLARGERRRHEIGVRLALGAGRGRIVRQLMAESALLAFAGAAAGLLVAGWGTRILALIELPGGIEVGTLGLGFNPRVLAFAAGLGAVTALAFGLVPALRASSTRETAALHRRGATEGPRGGALRGALVAAQVALCLVLLVGAALFLRSLRSAMVVDLGYDADRLGVVRVDLALGGYDRARATAFVQELEERAEASRAVAAASWAMVAPLEGARNEVTFTLSGYVPAADEPPATLLNVVGPGHFETTGTPLVRGRGFTESEAFGGAAAVVVNQPFVDRWLAGRDPIGEVLGIYGVQATIVGVARTVVHREMGEEPQPFVYVSAVGASLPRRLSLVVRARGDTGAALDAAVDAARALDPDLPVMRQSLDERLGRILMPQRVAATLFGLFSALTLVLAATGIYGVIAYTVNARTREFGIRLALGARPAAIVGLVARRGLAPVAAGLALGVAGALAAGRAVSALLFGVEPGDPATLAAVVALFAVIALAASVVPALRAGRVEPARVLREE